MTLPAGTIAQPTAQGTRTVVSVDESDTAVVTTYSDGSTDIRYKNQPIVDAECANITTADLNNGLVCQYNVGVAGKPDYFEYRYIPTERWTKQVQTWGQLKANMDRAATLNPKFAESARHTILFNNPSWHQIISNVQTPDGKYRSADGLSLMYHIEKGEYDVIGYPDSYVPAYIGPTTTSGGAQVFIKDPTTGTLINTTDISDPNAPIPSAGGKTITQLVYPNGQPSTSPITAPNDVPIAGTVGGGTPIAGPLGSAPETLPIIPPRPPTTVDVRTMVNTAAASQPSAGGGKWVLWAIGAAVIWFLVGG